MIADTLRNLEIDAVPLATPTGRLVGASGLLLESVDMGSPFSRSLESWFA